MIFSLVKVDPITIKCQLSVRYLSLSKLFIKWMYIVSCLLSAIDDCKWLSYEARVVIMNIVCMLLLISMLWHRQAIFELKGDKLSSSAECRIRTHQGLRHQIASRLNARWQTDWAIEDQAKNLNSTARPYDQPAFSPLDPTAVWHSHLALAIYMFVVVNFNALTQASDIRIERKQVVFLCWMQDSNPSGSQTPNRQQTECPLTNRLSYWGSS